MLHFAGARGLEFEILMPSSAAPETGADLRVTIIEPDGAERLVFTGHAPAQIAPVN